MSTSGTEIAGDSEKVSQDIKSKTEKAAKLDADLKVQNKKLHNSIQKFEELKKQLLLKAIEQTNKKTAVLLCFDSDSRRTAAL